MKQTIALICIDFINEMVSEKGKLSGKGYSSFVEKHSTLINLKNLQSEFRRRNFPVIHVKISFSENYIEQPKTSPLFGKAQEFSALKINTWGTDFHELVLPETEEKIILKRRVSAFFGTDLEITLRNQGISKIYLSGVSTDLAIESAARDAHDRDFTVNIVEDCCAAASEEDHHKSISTLKKISTITKSNQVFITN